MKRPLLLCAAGFVLGEVLALQPEMVWPVMCALTVLGLASAFLLLYFGAAPWFLRSQNGWEKKSRSALIRTLLLFFILILGSGAAGFGRSFYVKERLDKVEAEAAGFQGKRVKLSGRIVQLEEKEDSVTMVLEESRVQSGKKQEELGCVSVYITKDVFSDVKIPGTGCRIKLLGSLELIEEASNPGVFDFRGYYRSKSIACRFFGEKLLEITGEEAPYYQKLRQFKEHCRTVLYRICQAEDAAVYEAVLLGDDSSLTADVKTLYQKSGIAHLLAISGQHLTILGGGIYLFLRHVGLGFGTAGFFGAVLVVSYGIMTGSSGSAMRAVIMILCLWLARKEGKTYDTLSALGLAALFLLWREPYMLFQSGFQLSFGAVLSISGLGSWLMEMLPFQTLWQKTLAVSSCIQIVMLPVMLWHYYQYPLYGLVLNLFILPLVPVLMYSGLMVIAVGSFWQFGGVLAAGAGHYVLAYYNCLCKMAGKLPGYCLIMGRPDWVQIMAYLVLAAVGSTVIRKRWGRKEDGGSGWAPMTALFLMLGTGLLIFFPRPVTGMQVLCMDVGQGDGFLLRTGRRNVLIDGGSSSEKKLGEMMLEPCLKSMGITTLDYAVVSHGDADHISGLQFLLEQSKDIRISVLVLPAAGKGQEPYGKLKKLAADRGTRTIYMESGQEITAGELRLSCIYSGEGAEGERNDRNAHSLVLCGDYKMFHMMFTGDMGSAQEQKLLELARTSDFRHCHLEHAQILKVAHHGSDSSSDEAFLDAMPLKMAVLSYGKGNSYGHPSGEVLKRLEERGIRFLETGKAGAIWLETDGERVWFRCFKGE